MDEKCLLNGWIVCVTSKRSDLFSQQVELQGRLLLSCPFTIFILKRKWSTWGETQDQEATHTLLGRSVVANRYRYRYH